MIYDISLQWPDSTALYQGYNKKIEEYYYQKITAGWGDSDSNNNDEPEVLPPAFPAFDGRLSTPTILLLCRAVTAECLPMLRSRRLVVDRLPPWLPGQPAPMRVSQFLGRLTVQSLRHLEIRMSLGQGRLGSGWAWITVVDDLFGVLLERNRFETLRVMVRMCDPKFPNTDPKGC